MSAQRRRDDHEGLAQLLRSSQPQAPPPDELMRTMRAVVHDEWRSRYVDRRRRRRRVWRFGGAVGVAALATLVMILSLVWSPSESDEEFVSHGPVAHIERLEGEVQIGRSKEAKQLDGASTPLWTTANTPGVALAAGSVVETGWSSRAAVRMRSGASLRLDVGTRIRLVGQIDDESIELLAGGVYIDSDHGAPLTVETQFGWARDIGTRFEVRLVSEGLRVRVREGEVEFERGTARFSATAGEQLSIGMDGVVDQRLVDRFGPDWRWSMSIAPQFQLEGETLWNYLGWVSSETGLEIRFRDDELLAEATEMILHGAVTGLRADQSLDAVLPICSLRYSIDGGVLLIEREVDRGNRSSELEVR